MIYNFNLGIGWASSGVEYAQSYRAKMFRNINASAKFVFTDMLPKDNIQHLAANLGFKDDEIIWIYTYFTDCKTRSVSYTLKDLEKTFDQEDFTFSRKGKIAKYVFNDTKSFYTAYMVDEESDRVHRVEFVSKGFLIRKDYYTYCRIFSEYYAPMDHKAKLYQRRFFNEDGTIAYEEIVDEENSIFKFPDRILYSKEEFVGYMVSTLNLTKEDIVIIDRTTGIGPAIIKNVGEGRVCSIIHADHFNEGATNEDTILWNNYYEYIFAQNRHVDFYVAATDAQNKLVTQQFEKYLGVTPNVVTIPVGSLEQLMYPIGKRKKASLITASRLAPEKHVDWVIEAVVQAKKEIPELTLDIFGKGKNEKMLEELIEKHQCGDYVRLCGQQKLEDVYVKYEAYVSGSTSEGFGLSLMEAVGSGLPIIGFDVRYGNQTFIDDGKNGYLIPITDKMDGKAKIKALKDNIIKLFNNENLECFHEHSYLKAKEFLTTEVEKRWEAMVKQKM